MCIDGSQPAARERLEVAQRDSNGQYRMIRGFTRWLLIAPLAGVLASAASAQAATASQPDSFCFEVIAGSRHGQPEGAILLNRCSGETWVLVKANHRSGYQWKAIVTETMRASRNPPTPPGRAASYPMSNKCFHFGGKRYCE